MAGALGEAMNIVYSIFARDETRAGLTSAQTGLRNVKGAAGEAAAATESFASRAKTAAVAAGGALVGLAVAYSALTAGARDANARIAMSAETMSVNTEALVRAERAIANYHLGMGEASKAGDIFAKQGITNISTLTGLITTSDQLGEVLRQDADTISGSLVPAIAALGGETEDLTGLGDDVATMFRQSNVSLDGFSTLAKRMGPDLDAMGFSIEDVMALAMTSNQRWGEGRQVLARYKTAITDTKKEIDDYAKAVSDNAADHDKLVSAIETTESTLASLAEQVAATERSIANYDKDIADASAEVDTLAAAYAAAQTNTDEYAAAYERVSQEAESLVGSLASEQAQLASLEEQLGRTQAAHADLLDEYAANEQAIARLEAAYTAAVNANDYFAEGLTKANTALDRARDAYLANQDAIDGYNDAIAELRTEHADLLADQAKAAKTLADLQEEYRKAASSTAIVDDATKKHADELEKLQESYERTGQSIEDYTGKLEDNAREREKLLRDSSREQETLAELQAEYDSLTAAKNSQGGQLYIDPALMEGLADKIQASRDKVDDYSFSLTDNADSTEDTQQALAKAREDLVTMGAELKSAREDATWYTDAVTKQAEAIAALGEKVKDAGERYGDFGTKLEKNGEATRAAEQGLAKAAGTTGDLATAVGDAKTDVAEFGTAAHGAVERLSPYQEALQKTQERAAGLQQELGNARDRQQETTQALRDNESAQTGIRQQIGDTIGKLHEYDLKLGATNLELDKFRQAHLDIIKDVAPFEEAQARTAEKIASAAKAYKDSVDRLADLKQSRADEVSKLQGYREEYQKTTDKLNDLQTKLADNVTAGEALRSKQAEMNDVKALFLKNLGLEDTALDTNKKKLEDNTGALKDNYDLALKRYGLKDKIGGDLDNTGFDIFKKMDELGVNSAITAVPLGLAALPGLSMVLGKLGGLFGGGGGAAAGAAGETIDMALGADGVYAAAGGADAATVAAGGAGAAGGVGAGMAAFAGLGSLFASAFASQIGPLGSLLTMGPILGPVEGASGIAMKPIWDFLLGGGDKKVSVDTDVREPTGDGAGVLGWLSGARDWVNGLTAASGAKLVPFEATLDPTVTGGETVTQKTQAAIDAGLEPLPDETPVQFLSRIYGRADDGGNGDPLTGSVFLTADGSIRSGMEQLPDEDTHQWLTRINGMVANPEWWQNVAAGMEPGITNLQAWYDQKVNNIMYQGIMAEGGAPLYAQENWSQSYTGEARTTGGVVPEGRTTGNPGTAGVTYGGTAAVDNSPTPTLSIKALKSTVVPGEAATLLANQTNAQTVRWYIEGSQYTGMIATHAFHRAGTYDIMAQAVSRTGKTATAHCSVTVSYGATPASPSLAGSLASGLTGSMGGSGTPSTAGGMTATVGGAPAAVLTPASQPPTAGSFPSRTYPRFHSGGTFQAPAGASEGIAILQSGEKVTPPGEASNDGVLARLDRLIDVTRSKSGDLIVKIENLTVRTDDDVRRIADQLAELLVDDNYRAGIKTGS